MNFQFYLEKLHNSDAFKEFISKNSEAYFCSGFFSLDVSDGRDNQRHIDYYIPLTKKIISFKLDSEDGVKDISQEARFDVEGDFTVPEKLNENIDFDLNEIQKLIEEEIVKQKLETKIGKILVSLQRLEEKNLLVCTVFVSRFGLLKVNLGLESENGGLEITQFGKKSLFDLVRKGD